MQCQKCNTQNLIKAKYCRSCGTAFTEDERQEAYDQTIYGKLDRLENLKGWIGFSNITSHPIVRILVLVVLGILVWINVSLNGSHLSLRDSEEYTVARQKDTQEYYVLTDLDEVQVHIFLPQETTSLTVGTYVDETCIALEEIDENGIVLKRNTDDYYVLTATYTDGKQEQLLFFVCQGE